jgi:Transcription factor zinc-finger
MEDEKDRLREKLDQKKKGDEDRFFAEREKAAIERLRRQNAAPAKEKRCPRDGALLAPVEEHGVTVDECPTCRGVWLDRGELETIVARERDSWLGRVFLRPRR